MFKIKKSDSVFLGKNELLSSVLHFFTTFTQITPYPEILQG
jgi:hypothetical protein